MLDHKSADPRPLPDAWRFRVVARPDLVAAEWDFLAANGAGTPFQYRPWVEAWLDTVGNAEGLAPAIVLVEDGGGSPAALFPLALQRRGRYGRLVFAGGKHASYHVPLFDPARFRFVSADATRRFLIDLARAVPGADIIELRNQPPDWRGMANPLAPAATRPATDHAYRTPLPSSIEMFLRAIMGSDSRKKLAKKRRRLELDGQLRFVEADTPILADHLLAAFHAQKAARFAALGLPNPFAAPGAADFIARASRPSDAGGRAAIRLFAILHGDKVAAIFGGTGESGHFCGMFNSHDIDPVIARSSPGELVLIDLCARLIGEGFQGFDLGVGDAPYKLTYCPEAVQLVDTVLPATAAGRIAVGVLSGRDRLKGFVKRHPRLLRLATRVAAARS